jgi:hypothetical protein
MRQPIGASYWCRAPWTSPAIPPDTRAEMDTSQVPELLERPEWLAAVKADPAAKLGLRKDSSGSAVRGLSAAEIKALSLEGPEPAEGHVFDWTMSTERQDRDRDIIEVAGWGWQDFLRTGAGPVLLCHNSWGVPIAKMPRVSNSGGALAGVLVFPTKDEAPDHSLAHTCRQMINFGALSMGSVGFYPLEWLFDEDIKGLRFKKQELLEFSPCAVPSNPDAVRRAKAAGINLGPLKSWAEEVLDRLDAGTRKTDPLQEIWKATKSPRVWVEGAGGVLHPFERPKNAEEQGAAEVEQPAPAEEAAEPPAAEPAAEVAEEPTAESETIVELVAEEPLIELDEAELLDIDEATVRSMINEIMAEGDAHYIATKTPLTGRVPA